jgi:hypothetical protein
MPTREVSYYRQRAEVEMNLATKAQHPRASAAHQQLATLYMELASGSKNFESLNG